MSGVGCGLSVGLGSSVGTGVAVGAAYWLMISVFAVEDTLSVAFPSPDKPSEDFQLTEHPSRFFSVTE